MKGTEETAKYHEAIRLIKLTYSPDECSREVRES